MLHGNRTESLSRMRQRPTYPLKQARFAATEAFFAWIEGFVMLTGKYWLKPFAVLGESSIQGRGTMPVTFAPAVSGRNPIRRTADRQLKPDNQRPAKKATHIDTRWSLTDTTSAVRKTNEFGEITA